MNLGSDVAQFFNRHLIEPFVTKPGMDIPAGAAERLTVEGGLAANHWQETFVQADGGRAVSEKTGKVLDMTPEVQGGFKNGDIILRGNSAFTTAESGWAASVKNFFTTGHWQIERSKVSHVAMIARDPAHQNGLRVIQMVSGDTPKDLAPLLSPLQRKAGGTFIRNDAIGDFFNNAQGRAYTDAAVVRFADEKAAAMAARHALADYNNQVARDASGKVIETHPWYSKLFPWLAPDHRGGVCSDFVNRAYDGTFKNGLLPPTPLSIETDKRVTLVGETAITKAVALPAAPKRAG